MIAIITVALPCYLNYLDHSSPISSLCYISFGYCLSTLFKILSHFCGFLIYLRIDIFLACNLRPFFWFIMYFIDWYVLFDFRFHFGPFTSFYILRRLRLLPFVMSFCTSVYTFCLDFVQNGISSFPFLRNINSLRGALRNSFIMC